MAKKHETVNQSKKYPWYVVSAIIGMYRNGCVAETISVVMGINYDTIVQIIEAKLDVCIKNIDQ